VSRRFVPCTVAGTGSLSLQVGDVVTGSAVRDIVLQNGLVKVTYEAKTPDAEKGAHTLYRWDGSVYTRAMSTQYGDWTYFAVAFTVIADRATVIEAGPDAVEVAFQWDALDMTAYNSGGPAALGPADEAVYTSGGVQKKIATTKLIKTIRVVRGREGYFTGYHSIPRVGPQLLPTNNKESAAGEREFGTGGGNRVFFTSAGVQCLHPDHGDQAGWAGQGFTGSDNRACWGQHDDPTSTPWNAAGVIALQPSGFPGTQTTGPWWVADLDYQNATTVPFCRYIATVARFQTGSWQFGSGQYGATVIHYANEAQDSTGKVHPFQIFIGAFLYTSPNLALEPTTALKQRVANRCPLNFDDSGNAEDNGTETMTAASVRDELIAAVEALS